MPSRPDSRWVKLSLNQSEPATLNNSRFLNRFDSVNCSRGFSSIVEMKARDISSGEVSSISSDNEELPTKVLCRHSPGRVRPSKGVRNRVWQSVALENTLEKAFKSTTFDSDRLVLVNRGTESYCVDENEIATDSTTSTDQRSPFSRKRRLSERLAPRSYDVTIPRDHYGVTFDSSSDEVASAIVNFLQEDREDLIGRIIKTIGVKRALEFCYLTEDIEKCGGLYTTDGTRRRTPGGVFFLLIRRSDHVSRDEKKIVFKETSKTKLLKKRLRQAQRRRAAAAQARKRPPDYEETVDFKDLPSPNTSFSILTLWARLSQFGAFNEICFCAEQSKQNLFSQ
ncbi:hypothetical protein TcWFU_006787 [Taenia crassiceps]|uniref:Phosphorylated adapter RNA export protein n=1 Tax=Taenia crassiceps TaxID=6207 RepID=A0ABR4Q1W9_9CEST